MDWLSDLASRETAAHGAYDTGALQAAYDREASGLEGQLSLMEQQRADEINTVGQYYDDFAQQINEIKAREAQGDYSQSHLIPYLQMSRTQKLDQLREQQMQEEDRRIAEEQRRFQNDLAMRQYQSSLASSRSSSGSSSSGSRSYKPTLSASVAEQKLFEGLYTQSVLDDYNYHYGTNLNLNNVESFLQNYGNYNEFLSPAEQRGGNLMRYQDAERAVASAVNLKGGQGTGISNPMVAMQMAINEVESLYNAGRIDDFTASKILSKYGIG